MAKKNSEKINYAWEGCEDRDGDKVSSRCQKVKTSSEDEQENHYVFYISPKLEKMQKL